MADVDDIHNISAAVERQWEKLEAADIGERDRDVIQRWVKHRRVHAGSYSDHTQVADLSKLRLAAERAATPLVDMGLDDVTALFDALARPEAQGGYGVTSDSGLDGYARPVRLLFEWMDDHEKEGDYGWYEQITTSRHSLDRYDPDDQLTVDEVSAIRAAARSTNTDNAVRDRAIVSFYADSAVRLGLGGQLRRKHVDLAGDRPTFQPNPTGKGQKGVPIRDYPLYDCVADLRIWLNDHHPDDSPEAPVWTKEGYDPAADEGALSTQRLGGVIRDRARDARIEKPTNPHNFRHSKIADMRGRGYTPDEIQRRVAWKDSVVADMLRVYGRPDDDTVLANIDEHEGREPPGDTEKPTGPPAREECGMCGLEGIAPGTDHCPNCGEAISAAARRAEQARAGLKDAAIDALLSNHDTSELDADGETTVRAILKTTDNPEALAPVLIRQFSG